LNDAVATDGARAVTTAAACAGWLAAAVVTALWWFVHRAVYVRAEAVARACHELRGPLTAAALGIELGRRGEALSAAQLRAIHSELGRARLALDDLASAPEGRMAPRHVESVDLRELLSDSVHAWQPIADDAGVTLRLRFTADVPPVCGDRLRLAQAAGNLIANAIEHGGGEVIVLASGQGTGVRLEVIDSGPGLPAPLMEIVRRARRGRGARGRGLAIAAAIATIHGGRLDGLPASGGGARLVLELPAAGCADHGRSGASGGAHPLA
jgi:signal transduction histidine kinase